MPFVFYLLHARVLEPEVALQLLRRREAQQIPIGRLALERGLLQVPQIFQILKHAAKTRQRFGEAGVTLGMLHPEQVHVLLGLQQDHLPSIPEMLVEMSICEASQVPTLLEEFRAWCQREDLAHHAA